MTEHEVVDIFVAQADESLRVQPDPDEVMAVKWVDLAELTAQAQRRPFDFTPWLRIYLAEHRDLIFGTIAAQ
jgi:isopentenyl-diphosphate delta-isomerase